jgi:glycosyltransferase involved in cell wall biosynthesis
MQHPAKAAFLGSGPLVPDFPGVIHTGSVQHDDLAIWLNAADVLALPTLAEGCCNAIAEALACALPIVTSDIPDLRWQVPDKGVVLVDPRDPDAIAAALDDLAANPDKVAQMRADLLALADLERDKNRADEILTWIQTWLAETAAEPAQQVAG